MSFPRAPRAHTRSHPSSNIHVHVSSQMEDPRLDCAILRPMEADGDHFLAYYLTKEDEAAVQFKQERLAREPDAAPAAEDEPTYFHFVRDYETVKVEQEVPNEFLLVLDEGTDDFDGGRARPKGAYYKNIERKMLLKKKRVNVRPLPALFPPPVPRD